MISTPKKQLAPRECDWCHKMFIPRNKRQRYCGAANGKISSCARNGQQREWKIKHGLKVISKVELECPVCHKKFVPRRGNQRYCGPDCQKQVYLMKKHPEGPMTKKYEWCRESFKTYNSKAKYCSDTCRNMGKENEKYLCSFSKAEKKKMITKKEEHKQKIMLGHQTGLSYGIVSSLWPDKKAIYQKAVYKMQAAGHLKA